MNSGEQNVKHGILKFSAFFLADGNTPYNKVTLTASMP